MVTWRQKAGLGLGAGWLTLAGLIGYGYVSRPSENPSIIVVLKPSESSYTASSTPQNSNQPYPAPSDTIFGTSLPSQGIQGGPGPSATSTPNRDTNSSPTSEPTQTPAAGLALSGGGSGPIIISGGSKERSVDSIVNEGLKTAPLVQDGASNAVCTGTQLPPGNLLYRIDLKWSDGAGRTWERETVGYPGAHIYFSLQFPGKNLLEISVYDKEGGIRQRVAGKSTISATIPPDQGVCRRNTRPDERAVLYVLRQGLKGLETGVFYGVDATTQLSQGLSRRS